MSNTSLVILHNNTDTEDQYLAGLKFVVEGVLIPVLTSLGLVGNILSIKVLGSPGIDMKVNSNYKFAWRQTIVCPHVLGLCRSRSARCWRCSPCLTPPSSPAPSSASVYPHFPPPGRSEENLEENYDLYCISLSFECTAISTRRVGGWRSLKNFPL